MLTPAHNRHYVPPAGNVQRAGTPAPSPDSRAPTVREPACCISGPLASYPVKPNPGIGPTGFVALHPCR